MTTNPWPGHVTRQWTGDADMENGNYNNRCGVCGETFTGHKYRPTCQICWLNLTMLDMTPALLAIIAERLGMQVVPIELPDEILDQCQEEVDEGTGMGRRVYVSDVWDVILKYLKPPKPSEAIDDRQDH